jgi:hypothetical protein
MTYEHDVFISYRRIGNVTEWARNHLVPRLRRCLEDELGHEPRIFFDTEQEAGTHWEKNLKRALQRSRLLIAIWSPPYFCSRWCLAEWKTITAREQVLGLGSAQNLSGLVYPIRYSDGARFPAEARNVQHEMIFKDWRYPDPQFAESELYLGFHSAVVKLAERITERLDDSPPWDPDWPVVLPEPPDCGPTPLPRL